MVQHKKMTSICAQLGLFWSLMSAMWMHSVCCVLFFLFCLVLYSDVNGETSTEEENVSTQGTIIFCKTLNKCLYIDRSQMCAQFTCFKCVWAFILQQQVFLLEKIISDSEILNAPFILPLKHLLQPMANWSQQKQGTSSQQCFTLFRSLLLKCQSWHLALTTE